MSRIVVFICIILCLNVGGLFGCGGNSEPPVITIEELQSEEKEVDVAGKFRGLIYDPHQGQGGRKEPDRRNAKKITWRLKASPPPKRDLLVRIEGLRYWDMIDDYFWVMITKSNNYSETFSKTVMKSIKILPLPTVYIVGEGVVLDKLDLDFPSWTLGNHKIPEDFVPPMYEVGEKSEILCEGCGSIVVNVVDENALKSLSTFGNQ